MATVTQYPHYLFIETTGESVQDSSGMWSESEVSRDFLSMCREETDGKGSEYQVAGGEFQVATSLIQLPTSCPDVAKGAKVIIADDKDGANIRISGVCLNFNRGQLHCRLWV